MYAREKRTPRTVSSCDVEELGHVAKMGRVFNPDARGFGRHRCGRWRCPHGVAITTHTNGIGLGSSAGTSVEIGLEKQEQKKELEKNPAPAPTPETTTSAEAPTPSPPTPTVSASAGPPEPAWKLAWKNKNKKALDKTAPAAPVPAPSTTAAAEPDKPPAPVATPNKPNETPLATDEKTGGKAVETSEEKAARKTSAESHFKKGVEFYKKKDWAAAGAEFFASIKAVPSWNAVWYASRCLQQLRRYDESVDMLEILFRDFEQNINKENRLLMQQELVRLRDLVGAIDIVDAEFDASIRIDGRNRGTYPATAPHRVPVGTHIVRVYKEGYDPYETSLDVGGNQIQTIRARLRKLDLDRAGRLRVTESNQRELNVVIDGHVVGKTPWEGQLRDGEHSVVLEGEDDWGTQPAIVHVTKGKAETLGLVAEQLEASLKVVPSPAGATVAIDGVSVGRGVWQGRVRTGKHRVEIAANGYVLYVHEVTLAKGNNDPIVVKLDRDPLSPLWKDNRGRVFIEGRVAGGWVPTFGGDMLDACGDGCSAGLGLASQGMVQGGYRFPSGFFVDVGVGYFYARQKVAGQSDVPLIAADGGVRNGTVDDTLSLRGITVGASAGIRIGKKLPVSFRLGAGALVGAKFRDHRVGTFAAVGAENAFSVDVVQYHPTFALYVAPSVQVAIPLAERLHLQGGIDAMVLFWPGAVPTWSPNDLGSYVRKPNQELAAFEKASLMNNNLVMIAPSVTVRYEF